MEKIYTLKVYPKGMGRTVYRVMEICGQETLEELCEDILRAFEFDTGHMYEFCMDGKMYSENSYRYDPWAEDSPTAIRLDRIGLQEKQKFLLHYDFGDDWQFMITVQKILTADGYRETQLIKEKGDVEQYPDWDDYEEE